MTTREPAPKPKTAPVPSKHPAAQYGLGQLPLKQLRPVKRGG
jgi:hypothetical protein